MGHSVFSFFAETCFRVEITAMQGKLSGAIIVLLEHGFA